VKLYKKILYSISWVPIILLLSFPLLILWPFINLTWWQAFLPVGLVPLGLITVPIALMFDKWPKVLWLWNNDEEGCPEWWLIRASNMGWFIKTFPRFWWFAVRNPLNNHRFLFKDRQPFIKSNWGPLKDMEAGNMLKRGQAIAYRWAYKGPFAGYRRVWLKGIDHYSEFWIGWKIGSDVPGMGFTLQFRPKRKIGT
jgi:hypothetical protein